MIAVDTNIVVWGVRKLPVPDRPDINARCEALLEDHKRRHIDIMVPSVVLAEYLAGHDADAQRRAAEVLGKHFFIAPFDAKSAAIAAELFDKASFDKIKEEFLLGRQCLKIDYKVVATAIAFGASRLFADDGQFTKIADGRIICDGVPPLRKELFSGPGATQPPGRQQDLLRESDGS